MTDSTSRSDQQMTWITSSLDQS